MARVSRLGNSIWQHQTQLHFLRDTGIRACLILLNQPLDSCILKRLWEQTLIKICTDGGINRLHSAVGEESERYLPDVICGDFDSANEELLTYYKKKGSLVIPTPDQDETDFTKGLRVMLQTLADRKAELPEEAKRAFHDISLANPFKYLVSSDAKTQYDCLVCLGAFGGRFDHLMANVNTLYTASELQKKPCYLLSPNQVVCLLQPGSHVLHVDTGFEGSWCSLIPIGTAANHVYTTGLKWNLNGERLSFGSLISTSNTFQQNPEVTVETTEPLIWAMGVNFR